MLKTTLLLFLYLVSAGDSCHRRPRAPMSVRLHCHEFAAATIRDATTAAACPRSKIRFARREAILPQSSNYVLPHGYRVAKESKAAIGFPVRTKGTGNTEHMFSQWGLVGTGNRQQGTSHAGRRTDFRDKKSTDFSGEIFLERNYCPRTGFSGSNP